jgi:hypothetical protein
MVLVHRHKMYRKVYTGGIINPVLQIATNAGTALLPHIGRSHAKKLLLGALSGVASAMLAKALEKGSQYMSRTLSHRINMGVPMNNILSRLLSISPSSLSVIGGDPHGVKAIDREMVPIKNQLMAQTADINVTEAPIREVAKEFENMNIPQKVAGYGRKPKPKVGGMHSVGYGVIKPHLNSALNKRADMLLRNILN